MVSALTTVMAFIPILIMQLEVGQLFRDIAVAISVSVLLSLIVSVTVIPALSSRLLKGNIQEITKGRRINFIDYSAARFVERVLQFTRAVTKNRVAAAAAVISCLLYHISEPTRPY